MKHGYKNAGASGHGYGAGKGMASPGMSKNSGLKTANQERSDVKGKPSDKNPFPNGLA